MLTLLKVCMPPIDRLSQLAYINPGQPGSVGSTVLFQDPGIIYIWAISNKGSYDGGGQSYATVCLIHSYHCCWVRSVFFQNVKSFLYDIFIYLFFVFLYLRDQGIEITQIKAQSFLKIFLQVIFPLHFWLVIGSMEDRSKS